jgi:hypothetical protein
MGASERRERVGGDHQRLIAMYLQGHEAELRGRSATSVAGSALADDRSARPEQASRRPSRPTQQDPTCGWL